MDDLTANKPAWLRLKELLIRWGNSPEKDINENSLPEDFFNVIVNTKDGGRYAVFQLGNEANSNFCWNIDLEKYNKASDVECIAGSLEFLELSSISYTNPQ